MLNNRIFLLRLSIAVEIWKVWLKAIVFSEIKNRLEHEILAKIVDNSSKTHRIRSKQASFDSIRSTLQVDTKNMHSSLKY